MIKNAEIQTLCIIFQELYCLYYTKQLSRGQFYPINIEETQVITETSYLLNNVNDKENDLIKL